MATLCLPSCIPPEHVDDISEVPTLPFLSQVFLPLLTAGHEQGLRIEQQTDRCPVADTVISGGFFFFF